MAGSQPKVESNHGHAVKGAEEGVKEMKKDISRVIGFAFASLGEETSGRKRKEVKK